MTNQTSEPDEARQVRVTKKELAEKFKKAFADGLGGAVAKRKDDGVTIDLPPMTVTVGTGVTIAAPVDVPPVTVPVGR